MASGVSIRRICVALAAAATLLATACGSKLEDTVFNARNTIFKTLQGQGIYERNNLPEDNPPPPEQIKGWFDVVGGAYRHIVNEDRNNRTDRQYRIERGDSISFMFDAKVFGSGDFDRLETFYTNIKSRIQLIAGNNPRFDTLYWPTDPMKIKVGEDRRILKSLQEALISCMAGDGDPANDDQPEGIASDRVRVYLTPDIAFGDRVVYNVPGGSTLVFEVTDIEIIK